jgi:hypothetical protein
VVSVSSQVLSEEDVMHAFFKTPLWFPTWGADADVIVPKELFSDSVSSLMRQGFQPVDDLSKTYETGLVFPGRRIVLDLHTEMAFMGIPYIDRDYILKPERLVWHLLNTSHAEQLIPYIDSIREAVVRIGHSVIKERGVDLIDLAEVARCMSGSRDVLLENLQIQGLHDALSLFLMPLMMFWSTVRGGHVSASQKVSDDVYRSAPDGVNHLLPWRVPLPLSLQAMNSRMRMKGDIPGRLPTPLKNLRYRRNAERLGHLLLAWMTPNIR